MNQVQWRHWRFWGTRRAPPAPLTLGRLFDAGRSPSWKGLGRNKSYHGWYGARGCSSQPGGSDTRHLSTILERVERGAEVIM